MPIEIKELVIKINVESDAWNQSPVEIKNSETETIIAACVEQVLEILAKKEER